MSRAEPLLGAGVVAALLGLWELAPRAGWVREQSVPPFSDVAEEVANVVTSPEFFGDLGASAGRWAVGLALAVVIGVALGMAMGRSRVLHALVDPLLVVGYPVPKAALILLFVLWWGAGDASRVAVIVTGSLIPIVISAYHGAAGVPPALLWSARGLGIRRTWRVVLGAALPQILSGLRLAIGISLFTALASELLIRGSGIGSSMFTALDNGQTRTVFAMSAIVATIGFLVDALYAASVRRLAPWLEGDV
ncbi:MAG TPA: ABC transporter permease [Solirubrobacteraceae bacterium]|nr:ABC transporter permease [Solirubrobacteraceae bacterium]